MVKGEPVERRLAAILAADVVGYSRLMGQDEPGTLARLKAHRRELIDPEIAEHKGRVVKTTGDGILIEFPSVVEAVACAVVVAWSRTSSPACRGSNGCSSSPATRPLFTRERRST
jgi:adenylate cyclase